MSFMMDDVDIEGYAIETLEQSTEFRDFCVAQIGTALNFYGSTPVDGALKGKDEGEDEGEETLPSLTAYFTDDTGEKGDEYGQNWILPIAIRIVPDRSPEVDGNITRYTSPKKLKLIAIKAINILAKDSERCGVNGQGDINVFDAQLILSEIGENEREDIQASISIAFRKLNTI